MIRLGVGIGSGGDEGPLLLITSDKLSSSARKSTGGAITLRQSNSLLVTSPT